VVFVEVFGETIQALFNIFILAFVEIFYQIIPCPPKLVSIFVITPL